MRLSKLAALFLFSTFISVASAQSDSQRLDAAVRAAIARGDFRAAKDLALTPAHWTWIEAAAEADKKLGGLTIGMSAADVRKSSWGEPQKINRNVNSGGETEQWVYSSDRYLYFRNGKLTTAQNH